MSDTIIKVENISKRYRLGAPRGYKTLRESLAGIFSADRRGGEDTIWALKDISFEVKRGEAFGIIGRNGAGKSTLLKVLSRITEPTAGRAELRGRVGSLLEVGTGFHPELTGRENIYLYGSILGMSRTEVRGKFDEIVSFAELERFIDTPVKRYSSGMYMRLAFSVAAHVNPEILLVDEVLAVGDAVFQTRCLAKMRSITSEGRTVLFVSHNLAALGSICKRALVLDGGKLLFQGPVQAAVNYYEAEVFEKKYLSAPIEQRQDRSGSGDIRLTDFHMEVASGDKTTVVINGRDIRMVFTYRTRSDRPVRNVDLGIIVERPGGEKVFQFGTRFTGENFHSLSGAGRIVCTIKRFPLVPGRYRIGSYFLSESAPADFMPVLTYIDVVDGDFYGSNYQVFEKETPILVDGGWSLESKP
ncbi:MAG: ABC transporter ATP-binding protein [Elusimicrobiales bacterium]